MGSKRNIIKLKDVVDVITSKVDVSLINISDYISTENMLTDFQGITLANSIPSTGKITKFNQGDILFSNIRTYFKKIWLADRPGACSNDVIVFRPKDNIEPSYIFSVLIDPKFIDHTVLTSKGTKMPRGDKKAILDYEFKLSSSEERKFISKINSIIFEKINCNKLINSALEKMSQTLFKSWFVDFDPVIDNALDAGNPIPEALQSRAELRQKVRNSADFKPLPADIRALFPAEFEETELGWVPKGWENVTFDSFCDLIQSGGTPSRKETSFWDDGTIKWLSSGEVKGKIVLDTKEKITNIGLLNSSAKLWAKYTTVVAMYGATAGEVCLIGDKMTANQACCGLYSEKYPFYVYNFVSDKAYELASKATGSAQQNLNKLIISSTKFTRPSNAIISIFEDNVAPLFMNWFSNSAENNTLSTLRDTLLPKLISGELSLEDLPDLVTQTEPA
ncbi:TPA: restriction endonuclease subunit S [Klebsiella pneumoniae]|uniref:restriction endonuclease subunit S n=1 Tax=Klebsiella pneumoniae TaxID=573 RepID=UPI0010C38F61|nr:restriction endonuclease subunit S [Klebsiella pneumoniae]MBC4398064.1 restriction endonuclease subunit S [Klebsiella pneumoniae]MCE0303184.1 restriction endonuclease subunit S [Klebsiella pneumoniae]VAP83441.1 restriction modification system DNA specificity domain-containing protein [Klebsiella pneumoniae]VAP95654.1 restriction modification system DNA specificity domain-containing protein [Klebsiella pneumoniae]VTO63682.1 restriction modification system DNA specificity domain-containing pr